MLGVTVFGLFLTPVFYYVIEWAVSRRKRGRHVGHEPVLPGQEVALVPVNGQAATETVPDGQPVPHGVKPAALVGVGKPDALRWNADATQCWSVRPGGSSDARRLA